MALNAKLQSAYFTIPDTFGFQERFRENTFEIKVLTTTANGRHELEIDTGIPQIVDGTQVTYFKRWTKDHSHFSPALLWALRKEIVYCSIEDKIIIHIHAWWNLVSILSCCIAKWYKVPVVLSPRGMITYYTQNNRNSFAKKLIHNFIGKQLLRYCEIHATTEKEKQDILKIVIPKGMSVIPNLVSDGAGDPISDLGEVKVENTIIAPAVEHGVFFKIIFLSRIEEKKGLDILFESLAFLDVKWMLTIAGSGEANYINSLKAKAEKLKIDKHIIWVGQVADQNKFNLMAEHDLLTLPSYNENFGNVIIESLSVGTAVLVSDHVGLSDYVDQQKLGWISRLDVESIRQALLTAFSDHKKREIIRRTAPAIINRDYSDQVLISRYLNLYKSLVHE